MIKKCHVCGEEKEHASYKATTCNECLTKGFKWCTDCVSIQPIINFGKNGKTIRSVCKKCECIRSIKNKEKNAYYDRPDVKVVRNEQSAKCKRDKYNTDDAYRVNELVRCHNRRCTIEQTGTFTILEWNKTLNMFSNKCAYCGSPIGLTQDHIIPISKEGTNTIDNIIPACGHCNSSKCAHDMEEWFRKQTFFTEERLRDIKLYVEIFQEER